MNATRTSFLISFAEKYTLLLLSTVGAMLLARLLTPAEIGVYSVGAVLVGLAQVLRDFGVGPYLIQEKELGALQLRAALSTSILVAWLLAAVVLLASGPVAQFYREPRLQRVLQLLSINFILIPFSSVTLPYLRRQLKFGAIFAINTAYGLAQLICSVVLAALGCGYLSLAWASVAGAVAGLLASLILRPSGLPWLPGLRGMGRILSFGAYATGGGLVDEAGVAAPDLIIGKLIGVAGVGMFGKAMGVLNVFNQAVTSAISPVVFPLYSAQVRAGKDMQAIYLTTVSYLTALAWPFFAFLSLTAPAVVSLLYGDQWDAAVPLIRIMCASSAAYSMFSMARYLFLAMGRVQAQARLDAAAVPVRVIAVLLAAPLGLKWVAWAVVLGALFRCWVTYRYLVSLVGLRFGPLLLATRRSAMLTGLTCTAVYAVQMGMPQQGACLLWPFALAALAALLSWLAGLALLRHELAAELSLAGWRIK